jgi:L-amino acid N-acyltransferase YncA
VISTDTLIVDALTADDWPAVSAIYAEGIATRNATFETHVPSWEEWAWFSVVGTRERIGKLDGVWRDVVFLERRSRRIR